MKDTTITQATDTSFEAEVLQSDLPVLVDFWATWCQPCRSIAPHLDVLADRYAGKARIVKVDIDKNPHTPSHYGVRGIPTLLLFKDGQVVDQIVGNPGAVGPLDKLISRNL